MRHCLLRTHFEAKHGSGGHRRGIPSKFQILESSIGGIELGSGKDEYALLREVKEVKMLTCLGFTRLTIA